MALQRNTPRAIELGDYNDLPVLAGINIFEGAAVGVTTAGFAREFTTSDAFSGFADSQANNRKGTSGKINVRVRKNGHVVLLVDGVAGQESVGASVFALGNDVYALTGAVKIGVIERFEAGKCIVKFSASEKDAVFLSKSSAGTSVLMVQNADLVTFKEVNIATRCACPTAVNTGVKAAMSRSRHKAKDGSGRVKLGFYNGHFNNSTGETANPGTAQLAMAIEKLDGTLVQLLFGGNAVANLTSGQLIETDYAVAGLKKGEEFFVRTWFVSTSGLVWTNAQNLNANDTMALNSGEKCVTGTSTVTDATMTAGPLSGTNAANVILRPLYVVGMSSLPSIIALGDSRLGLGNAATVGAVVAQDVNGLQGNIESFAALDYPVMNMGTYGAGVPASSTDLTTPWRVKIACMKYATHAVVEFGINTVTGGATLADVKARLENVYSYIPIPKYQTTLEPVSSGDFTTVPGQTTVASNTVRTGLNDAIRFGGLAKLDGYIEIADIVESARNSGLWKANFTDDGTHYLAAARAAVVAQAPKLPF